MLQYGQASAPAAKRYVGLKMRRRIRGKIVHASLLAAMFLAAQILHDLWKVGHGTLTTGELISVSTAIEFTAWSVGVFVLVLAALVFGGRVRGNDIHLHPLFAWFVAGGVAAFLLFGFGAEILHLSSMLVGGMAGVAVWTAVLGIIQLIRNAMKPNKAL